ncbi:MAG: hypothetical protein HS111_21620 [Kofleriaceae bacterium]|nr:hypothetical protein [Kofleriaceae bacterium]
MTLVVARPGDWRGGGAHPRPRLRSRRAHAADALVVEHLRGRAEVELDDQRKAQVAIPADAEGAVEITGGGARALVYVRPAQELTVALTAARRATSPGSRPSSRSRRGRGAGAVPRSA